MKCLSLKYNYTGEPPELKIGLVEFFTEEKIEQINIDKNDNETKDDKENEKKPKLIWKEKVGSILELDCDIEAMHGQIVKESKQKGVPFLPNICDGKEYHDTIFHVCLNEDYLQAECNISLREAQELVCEFEDAGYDVRANDSFYTWWNGFKVGNKLMRFCYIETDEIFEPIEEEDLKEDDDDEDY